MRTEEQLCPFIDGSHHRCASSLTLGGIGETFRLCAGDYWSCPAYQGIRRDQLLRDSECPIARSA